MKRAKTSPPASEPSVALLPARAPFGAAVAALALWLAAVTWSIAPNVHVEPTFILVLIRRTLAYQNFTVDCAREAATAFGFWVIWVGMGSLLVRGIRVKIEDHLERALVSAGFGVAGSSLALLFLGLARLWYSSLLQPLYFGALLLSGAEIWRLVRAGAGVRTAETAAQNKNRGSKPPSTPIEPVRWTWEEIVALALIVIAGLVVFVGAVMPEVFYDSLVYHLALPKLYLLRHRIEATPYNIYSGSPLAVQLIYGWALSVGEDRVASLLHASFGLATALGLIAWGRSFARRSTGILAALLFSLCPIAMYAGQASGIDLAACFLCSTALVATLRSLETNVPVDVAQGESDLASRWAIAAGLLVGAAMSTKYTVFPIGLIAIATHFAIGQRSGRPVRLTLLMGISALGMLFPWLLKNVLFFHNPLYPFLGRIFTGIRPADAKAFFSDGGAQDLKQTLLTISGLKSLLIRPWTASLDSRYLSDWPGPAFLAIVPWAFFLRWREVRWRAVALLSVGSYAAWLLSSTFVRYMLPSLPFIACAGALAVNDSDWPAWMKRSGWIVALLACGLNLQVAFQHGQRFGAWDYSPRYRTAFLNSTMEGYPAPYNSAMDFIAKNLKPDARVLFLGDARGYYCERDFIASTIYDSNPFWEQLREAKSAAELRDRLKVLGVTHIFLNAIEMLHRRHSEIVVPKDAIQSKIFDEFWTRYLRTAFEDRQLTRENAHWTAVYELLDVPNANPAAFPVDIPRYLLRPELQPVAPR